jgi:ribonuclease T2
MNMRPVLPLLVLLLLCISGAQARQRHHRNSQDSSSGQFYVLALSWAPNYCDDPSKPHSASECDPNRHLGFIVHGLWLTNADGSLVDDCKGGRPLGQDSVQALLPYIPDRGLIAHEWMKHWSCRGTPQHFVNAIQKAAAAVQIPTYLKQPGESRQISVQALKSDFASVNHTQAQDYSVRCYGGKLINFEACLTTDFQPMSCSGVHSCTGSVMLDALR